MNDGLEPFSNDELDTLKTLVNTVIPADTWPNGWDGGVHVLLAEHGNDFMFGSREVLKVAIAASELAARSRGADRFVDLSATDRADVISDLMASEDPGDSDLVPLKIPDPARPISSLVTICYQGFYRESANPLAGG